MMDYQSSLSDREFTAFPDLQKMSDAELREIYLRGDNIHITTSKASAAKRLLDIRSQQKQVKAVESVETVTQQLKKSHEEILKIVSKTGEIINILTFIKTRFLPNQPVWVKILVFIFGTVILGIVLNLAASYIGIFWLHWQ